MRRVLLLLCALAFTLPAANLFAGGGDDEASDNSEVLRRSEDANGSFPGGPITKAPLATGYYVTDNDAPATGPPWSPTYQFIDTTGAEIQSWRRVLSGPNQRAATQWVGPNSLGYEYFRNPNNMTDSTDNAMAGPISIGFPFYYYGRKYDSFYVSTNGLMALTNRRYQYDEQGNRVAYEPVFDGDAILPPTSNAITDPVPDSYGYDYVALGKGTNWYNKPDAGVLNQNNGKFPTPGRTAGYSAGGPAPELSVIAPAWDDCELSQFDENAARPDDFGRVYWRRDVTGTKLIIYYVNLSMKGIKNIPILNVTRNVPIRSLRADFQVVLDRTDSSVQFHYSLFRGVYQDPQVTVINIPSNIMFRSNATIGIQSHDQEFTNYLYNADFQGKVYVNGNPLNTPHNSLAIKFKQWKNVVRVLKVTFQVPSRFTPGSFVDLPTGQIADNFELLLGSQLLGVIKPVGIVENVSSDVGPVNVTVQPIRFNVVFRIRDLVNVANPPVYQRTATTRALYPIEVQPATQNSNPLRPNIDTIIFDPYITNAAVPRQAGRFRAEVVATDQGPGGITYGQQWPFDDTTGVRLFGIRRLDIPFINTFGDYDNSPEDGVIPSVQNWVSIGAQVVDGDNSCYNPPPPRGPVGPLALSSPVCLLDRKDVSGGFYWNNQVGRQGGDTLISFPLNLSQTITPPIMFLSYQRSGRQASGYPRGFADAVRIGPEHATYNTQKTGFFGQPDYIIVEFAEPSPNGIDRIVNIVNQPDWQTPTFGDATGTPRWRNDGTSPRWGIFGGGGGSDMQSQPKRDTTGKILTDEFDAGKDFEFYRAYIPIPTRWSKSATGSKTFRFRIRGLMKNDGNPLGPPADDGDNFYVDNVMVVEPDKPEVEVTVVKVDWPYTEAPASQARSIPLAVKIGNNGSTAATSFGVAMYVENTTTPPPPGTYNYYRYLSIISLAGGRDRVENFPAWNAQECGANIGPSSPAVVNTDYRIWGRILPAGFDSYTANDITYTDFRLTLGPTFAYDDGTNDVGQAAQIVGKGLNLVPPAQDGAGAQPFGPPGGTTSGTFAMQFRILVRDTVLGYSAYYGGANQAPDYVLYSIYQQPAGTNANNPPSGTPVASTRAYALRGQGIPTAPAGKLYHFDQYVTFLLDTPLVVDPGIYFATVAQLGQTGLELGGDVTRMGQVTTIRSDGPPQGVGNYSIPAHPEMRQNRFWFEGTTESGGWNPMLTQTNNPGFPNLNWIGQVGPTATYTRGSWVPMIRPYFGKKPSSSCLVEPVELNGFNLTELSTAIRLDWQTASELNNRGFNVERRVKGSDVEWNAIGYREGAGNSNQPRNYSLVDDNVVANTVYQYRLRQEDRDGSVNYSGIREGRINGGSFSNESNSLAQNTPNPVSASTRIDFSVANSGTVQLEINDVYGNVIRSYSVDAKAGTVNSVEWNTVDNNGAQVASGTYIYKLVGEGFSLSRKMTVAR
jgi:hypothetical protein